MALMIKKSLLFLCLFSSAQAENFEEYQANQALLQESDKKEFTQFQKAQMDTFAEYQKAQYKALESYKKSLGAYWNEPKLSTKKEWISYTPDKKTRTDVDFQKSKITLETITSSPDEAKKQLEIALAKVVTIDNKTVQKTDPLEQILSKIKKPDGVITKELKNEPILSNVIFDKTPDKKSVDAYVQENVKDKSIKSEKSKVVGDKVYSLEIALPSDTVQKKSQQYYETVKQFAQKEELSPSLVLAIIQTESSFNPRATSYVPAFGLMQIVPSSAGLDAYNYLHHEKKLVCGEYLYDSTNNIEMGSAYFHLLYYNYLSSIKEPLSRLYCAIAAYNTGAGNVAWAFNKNKNITEKAKYLITNAAGDINAMSSDEVYSKLLSDLKYEEPKLYLKNVSSRAVTFSQFYSQK